MSEQVHGYELLDFGEGRKLERFGRAVVLRPSPAAEGVEKSRPELWTDITARFRGPRTGDGSWSPNPKQWVPADWCFEHRDADETARFRLKLEALPSGQVGVFPEQRENWDWIAQQVARTMSAEKGESVKVLNLFAYTGASTLAAAAAGAEVVHIDAAQNIVDRARENAALSHLAERPIRWIAEDAMKFCRREIKRGNQYDGVIFDPPTYGHGPKGEPWKIFDDLLALLTLGGELTSERRAFVLVSCHSPGIGPAELAAYLAEGIFGHCGEPPAAGDLHLETAAGRKLASGTYARWPK
jgi:23S rRNA (cytosine1962-C5)-methyltransferase